MKKVYEDKIKKIGSDALTDLEPVIKKGSENLLNFVKLLINDAISIIFRSKIKKG